MKSRLAPLIFAVLIATAGSAAAQVADWQFGGRLLYVKASTTSEELGDTENRLNFDSGIGVEVDATVKFSRLFRAEFSAGLSGHNLSVSEPGCNCGDVDGGTALVIPLTVLGQYHLPVYGDWDPYVGIGFTWAIPIYDTSTAMNDAGIESLELEGGGGFAAQIGANYQMNNRWYANVDIRYLGYSLEARMTTTDGDLPMVELNTKPWVIGVGMGYQF